MAKLIRPTEIAFTATISEDQVRDRLAEEVLESIGALDQEGKAHPGVTATVKRGESRKGGYTVTVSGPMPARVYLPKSGE